MAKDIVVPVWKHCLGFWIEIIKRRCLLITKWRINKYEVWIETVENESAVFFICYNYGDDKEKMYYGKINLGKKRFYM